MAEKKLQLATGALSLGSNRVKVAFFAGMHYRGALPDFMEELSDALATIAVGDPSEVKKSKNWPLGTIACDRLASKVLASQY